MNEGDEAPKPAPEPESVMQATCQIKEGILVVEIPLFMPNGEYVAYGMLHKAAAGVTDFFKAMEREAAAAKLKGPRILTPN